jgi:hypothetical protein
MSHCSLRLTLCGGTMTSFRQTDSSTSSGGKLAEPAAGVCLRWLRSTDARLRVAHQSGIVLLSASGKRCWTGVPT